LLPALRRSGDARVVVLSSIGHRRGDVDFDDLDFRQRPYDPWVAYAQSKTANALFAVGMTQRHGGDGITTNAVNPGFIPTRLQRHMTRAELQDRGWVDAAGRPIRRDGQKTPEQGAATSVWAAVAPELTGSGGHYLEDCAIAAPWTGPGELRRGYLPYALDPSNAERLWAVTASRIAGA
jgi:NAD(P)-dependent dehydrogenase (short-subunit alcohol dehydrogenase family)